MDAYSRKMRGRFAKKPIRTDKAGGKVVRHKAAKPTVLPSAVSKVLTKRVRLKVPKPKPRPQPVRTPSDKPKRPRYAKPELVKKGDEQSHFGRATPGTQPRLRGTSSATKPVAAKMAAAHLEKRVDADVPNLIESVEHKLVEVPPKKTPEPQPVTPRVTEQTVGSPSSSRRQFQFTEVPVESTVLPSGGKDDEPSRGSNLDGTG